MAESWPELKIAGYNPVRQARLAQIRPELGSETLIRDLSAIAAPCIKAPAMVVNPAPRVVIILAKWSIGPGDLSFYWYIALGV